MSIPPSKRLNLNPVHIIAKQIETPSIVAGIIRYMVRSYDAEVSEIGDTNAAIPMESRGSVMLEPIRVPIATPWLFLTATIATVSSGNEVPNPDIVEPTIACGTLSWYAISQAYFTS